MTYLRDILDNLVSIVKMMTFIDYLDMFLLTFIVFWVIKFVRETRAVQLIKGILLFSLILLLIRQLEFKALGLISNAFINVGMMAIIVMFQPELRRMLEKFGRNNVVRSLAFNLEGNPSDILSKVLQSNEQISLACERLSRTAVGALIVMERQTKLGEQIDTGVILDAQPSEPLIQNIFFPHSPMHDGAVIVRNGLLLAAGCFLPKPQKEDLIPRELGSRHRAAIGMSEVSDALVVIVSEETGTISIAENGALKRGFDKKSLCKYLNLKLLPDHSESILRKEIRFKKIKKYEDKSNE
ncbi:MAG: diadenylate cyclase CdaA [Eubacterium sp.]|nr:diadenylate cyclase CdaA [Eubacterium sp.]